MSDIFENIEDENVEQDFSDEDIMATLAEGRTRGLYTGQMDNFAKSGQKMSKVDLTSHLFAGKTPANVKQGFENAKNAKSAPAEWANIVVKKITKDGVENLYLINQNLLAAKA
ncbi:MAG TPA: hypothetical protein VH593_08600 [Ktedonobacteraceae bacterium]|jgi:hypothetical protein